MDLWFMSHSHDARRVYERGLELLAVDDSFLVLHWKVSSAAGIATFDLLGCLRFFNSSYSFERNKYIIITSSNSTSLRACVECDGLKIVLKYVFMFLFFFAIWDLNYFHSNEIFTFLAKRDRSVNMLILWVILSNVHIKFIIKEYNHSIGVFYHRWIADNTLHLLRSRNKEMLLLANSFVA